MFLKLVFIIIGIFLFAIFMEVYTRPTHQHVPIVELKENCVKSCPPSKRIICARSQSNPQKLGLFHGDCRLGRHNNCVFKQEKYEFVRYGNCLEGCVYLDLDKFLVGDTHPSVMNCLSFVKVDLQEDEIVILQKQNIKFNECRNSNGELGELTVTTHHLYWGSQRTFSRNQNLLKLHLKDVKSVAEVKKFGSRSHLVLNLYNSENIKISGQGVDSEVLTVLTETLSAKVWATTENKMTSQKRFGIGSIQKQLVEKNQDRNEKIDVAFQDLSKLIGMAKEIVNLSKSVGMKMQKHEIDLNKDETSTFKTYLMSLGIEDPICKNECQNNEDFLIKLANEITQVILDTLIDNGGMMAIVEVYCRINRARGFELVSPEDVLHACRLLNGPIKLKEYSSGSVILQLETHDDLTVAQEIQKILDKSNSLSVEELSNSLKISIILANERFSIAEKFGFVCRDESVEGLRFYPNLIVK